MQLKQWPDSLPLSQTSCIKMLPSLKMLPFLGQRTHNEVFMCVTEFIDGLPVIAKQNRVEEDLGRSIWIKIAKLLFTFVLGLKWLPFKCPPTLFQLIFCPYPIPSLECASSNISWNNPFSSKSCRLNEDFECANPILKVSIIADSCGIISSFVIFKCFA